MTKGLDDFIDLKTDSILRVDTVCVDEFPHDPALEIPAYRDNPLILNLPPFSKINEIAAAIERKYIKANPAGCRRWSREKKMAALGLIRLTLTTTSSTLTVIDRIYSGIRARYAEINPLENRQLAAERAFRKSQKGQPEVIFGEGASHSQCLAVFGLSGTGKTSLVKMVLSTLPPVIRHHTMPECRFKQAVYVFVTAPHNGSVGSLLKSILRWFDENLKTHYLQEMRVSANTAEYVVKVAKVLQLHRTGLLVIDEIQNALRAAERTSLLDFLVNLLNENCCMVIAIGTGDSKPILRKRYYLARRFISAGVVEMDPLKIDDLDWLKVSDAIMRVDFLPEPPGDLEAVRTTLYRCSAGDLAMAKLAWEITQYYGILNGNTCVTPELIEAACEETFSTIKGLMDALRTRDYAALSNVVDMVTSALDERIQNAERQQVSKRFYGEYKARENQNKFLDAVEILVGLGLTQVKVEALLERLLRDEPDLAARTLVHRVLDELSGVKPSSNASPPTSGEGARGGTNGKARRKRRVTSPCDFDPRRHLDPSSGKQ